MLQAVKKQSAAHIKKNCAYTALIPRLLDSLQWKGEKIHLQQAMPASHTPMDLQQFRDLMAHLGYYSTLQEASVVEITASQYPLISVNEKGEPFFLEEPPKENLSSGRKFTFISFEIIPEKIRSQEVTISSVLQRFQGVLTQSLLISLLVGILALAPTIYSMGLYDTVIPSDATKGLTMLFAGVMLALTGEMVLRHLRSKRLGFFGARLDHFIGSSVFERLLFLPPAYTERASVSAQLARLRDFESVRDFFTGPLATLFFELPLIGIYLIAMVVLSGKLAIIPVVLLGAYALLLWGMKGSLKTTARNSAEAISKRQEFLLETLTKLRAIRLSGWEQMWRRQYRKLSHEASIAGFKAGFTAQLIEVSSYVLMMLGGVATLGFGVIAVIHQNLSVGALIASMMLIWRIVAPMQLCCASVSRLQQLSSSTRQIQRLLSIAPEHDPYGQVRPLIRLKGQVNFHRVSLRYANDSEPALLGVSFGIKPGQVVAIKGDNGSGKSSILKLILGLYTPQSGSVRLDGVDIRQFDTMDLRQSIAYVPQEMEILPGTLRDNLLYANPLATAEQCLNALKLSCATEEVNRLPHGMDTLIAGEGAEGISFLLQQRINLARAYLKSTSLMLFDEASHSLGEENDIAFSAMVSHLRGRCTVILATHREDHMRLADILLVMNKGELTHAGPPDQVLKLLQKKQG